MYSLTIFGPAGEKALQGHSKLLAILHQGANRAILIMVNNDSYKLDQQGGELFSLAGRGRTETEAGKTKMYHID
jgi:hypothetical protein